MTRLQKLGKKLNLNINTIEDIIVYNHELNNLIPKKQLKVIDLELNLEAAKTINKIAKVLKVDTDAVIGSLLKDYIKNKE